MGLGERIGMGDGIGLGRGLGFGMGAESGGIGTMSSGGAWSGSTTTGGNGLRVEVLVTFEAGAGFFVTEARFLNTVRCLVFTGIFTTGRAAGAPSKTNGGGVHSPLSTSCDRLTFCAPLFGCTDGDSFELVFGVEVWVAKITCPFTFGAALTSSPLANQPAAAR